jgi:two-component system, OmpR family, phosphate regulon response regulator PhoB
VSEARILVVEDERPIRDMIAFGLRRAGYTVIEAQSTQAARVAVADHRPDLALVDWMLPDGSGLELTRSFKRQRDTRDLPIIMLTARADESDKVAGLEGGADDYITKPFSPRELQARIQALLRRAGGSEADEVLSVGPLKLDRAAMRIAADGHPVELGPTEFRLLEFLLRHPERVYSREQLLAQVWPGTHEIEARTVDVHIRRLRAALEPFGVAAVVQTVRGAGYRLSVSGRAPA